jgi:threonine dehydrogenase-like Zn-dependent dehydrogenase
MRRLLRVVGAGRVDLRRLVTQPFSLDRIEEAYYAVVNPRESVLKVAIDVA